MNSNSYIDIYRYLNKDTKLFTWINRGGNQKARLDYFVVSSTMKNYVESLSILPSYKSDHAIISMDVNFDRFKRGNGLWRHDDTYLRDIDYLAGTKKTIYNTLAKYLTSANHNNFYEEATDQELLEFENLSAYEKNRLDYSINPNLLLEMLLNDIKNESISYITASKKEKTSRLNFVKKMIENLRKKNVLNQHEQNLYNDYVTEYDIIIENTARKIMKRDKILSKAFNEKPSKFFCNLEKDKSAEKFIPKLKCKTMQAIIL